MLILPIPYTDYIYTLKPSFECGGTSSNVSRCPRSYDIQFHWGTARIFMIREVPSPHEEYEARFKWLHKDIKARMRAAYYPPERLDAVIQFSARAILTDTFFRL